MNQKRNITEFVFLWRHSEGPSSEYLDQYFCSVTSNLYVTMVGNLLIVVTVMTSLTMDAPMYCFLSYLSFMDALYITAVTPDMILDFVYEKKHFYFVSMGFVLPKCLTDSLNSILMGTNNPRRRVAGYLEYEKKMLEH